MLLLCTANQCRSPMAEALLRHHLAEAGVDAVVSSAGLYEGGAPATADGQDAMADRGLDLRDHRSRQVDAALVASADLVIGMTREHVREAVVLVPDARPKAFTLKELVGRAEALGPRDDAEPVDRWVERLGSNRQPGELIGAGHDDTIDVADPVGRGRAAYDVTAALLDDLLRRLVAVGWPARNREGAA